VEKPVATRKRAVRADARENRAAIIDAALRRFASDGVNATMEGIAQEAGVAVGTLYHHFGGKEGLFQLVVDEGLAQAAAQIEQFLAEPDAWLGVERLVRFLAEKQWHNQAFSALVRSQPTFRAYTTTTKRQLGPVIQAVLDRAKATGQLRPDVQAADLPLLLAGGAAEHLDEEARERYLAIVLRGLRG